MKPVWIPALTAAVLLVACSAEKDEAAAGDPVAVKDVADKVAAAGLKPQAGLYKTTITMTGLDIPGLPPEMKGHGAGLARTVESCLTQAEVDKGFEDLLKTGQDGECRFDRFALAGGNLDAVLVCDAQGRTTSMAMTGALTPTTADIEASTAIAFDGVGEGTMNFTAKHERIGECPAG